MIYLDTETCGLCGPCILIQWAKDDGPIHLHDVWTNPIWSTLHLIEEMYKEVICGFNLVFDCFQIAKIYTMLNLVEDKDKCPEDIIEELALLEPQARFGPCVKPAGALDLMLHARKGPFQSLMPRRPLTIRKIPTPLAKALVNVLEERVHIDNIYFAKSKVKTTSVWKIKDTKDPNFKNIQLRFKPGAGLKTLALYALKIDPKEIIPFGNVDVQKCFHPNELGYAPYALAVGSPKDWKLAWPDVIRQHIIHWGYNKLAREYAEKDIFLTRRLHQYFNTINGKDLEINDDDSILAAMVGAVRWRGLSINVEKMKNLRQEKLNQRLQVPTAPSRARPWLAEVLSPAELEITEGSTRKQILEVISQWRDENKNPTPAAIRAAQILDARKLDKEIELYDKLILAGRFHASFVIIGTLSSRMAGSDKLNAQGIKHDPLVRACFDLADPGFILCGGDFDSFEVTLADAEYNDPDLRKDLLDGKKIHALLACELFPELTYEQIMSKEHKEEYAKGKAGVFALIYGGDENTLVNKQNIPLEIAKPAFERFTRRYKQIYLSRKKVFDDFCSMRQPGGIGSRVEWHEPAKYVESLFGFRRYFTLENNICKTLFELANNIPKEWHKLKIKVIRRDREQTAAGAVCSALYAAAFAIQASNMRAAANHRIQSSGAQVTKKVQRKIWDLQPSGINEWKVVPINIHDEIMCPCIPEIAEPVKAIVEETVESFRPKVPLIKMEWKIGMKSWAEK